MAETNWPNKSERERYEINGFIENYACLPNNRVFEIIEKREKPDYFVIDKRTREYFGVELTSVYLSDRSVPGEHIPTLNKAGLGNGIDLDSSEIEKYKRRVVEAVKSKIEKARNGYDLRYPLLLSVYINEYRAIFMGRKDWEGIVKENEELFNSMTPFVEVVFWSLANGDVFLVTPDK